MASCSEEQKPEQYTGLIVAAEVRQDLVTLKP